jgi:hypothetical protein
MMLYVDPDDPKLRALVDACSPNDDAGQQIRQLQSEVEHYRTVRHEQRCVISTYEKELRRTIEQRENARFQRDVATICAALLFGAAVIWLLAR